MDFIIQCIDKEITSAGTFELKDELDKEYKYLAGISISNAHCSTKAILEQVKLKGRDVLPENFEAIHVMASEHVAPNRRFFSWFKPVAVSGDEMLIRFRDPEYADDYNLQVQVLLTNQPGALHEILLG